jgi:hypothetical protein
MPALPREVKPKNELKVQKVEENGNKWVKKGMQQVFELAGIALVRR